MTEMKAAPDNLKMIQCNCKKAVNPVIAVVGNMDYRAIQDMVHVNMQSLLHRRYYT